MVRLIGFDLRGVRHIGRLTGKQISDLGDAESGTRGCANSPSSG
jgi:hypothetical protein